jgi:hypothetical protein
MRRRPEFRFVIFFAVTATLSALAGDTPARAQAIPGEPFGVAALRVPLATDEAARLYESGGLLLTDREGRTHYPVLSNPSLLDRLSDNLLQTESPAPDAVDALFLFRGTEPLDITVYTPAPQTIRLVPRPERPLVTNRLYQRWWRAYSAMAQKQARDGDHPPLVYTYLTSMLGQRLGLQPPLLSRREADDAERWPRSLQLLFGIEKLRDAVMRRTMQRGPGAVEPANRPLPATPQWGTLPITAADDVPVEPMSMHVPEECFFVHFGTFDNFLWFRDFLREIGGDLTCLIKLRGHNVGIDQRLQRQMALSDTVLVDLFGSRVASDAAIIGRDLFLREGPALGLLLQAKNSGALGVGIRQQREEALTAEKENGATLETVTIGNQQVSLLSTPDNTLRSYYAVDGDYHLVTTSRAIVERFFAAGAGDRPLGASAEFRYARSVMPLTRNDTIFAYFSSTFFQGLFSPQYQIELARRLEAVTDIELTMLARLAARGESLTGDTIEQLVAARLLPSGFGRRADGSGPLLEDKRVLDSLRGVRGFFLPVPDVELRGATASEVAHYAEQAEIFRSDWRQLDPLVVGIGRKAGAERGRELISIDAHLSPVGLEKYGKLLLLLGPATNQRIRSDTEQLMTIQASLFGGLDYPGVPAHQLFVGLEDLPATNTAPPRGLLQWLQLLQAAPGYLGAWPAPGFLDWLPVWIASEPDPNGFSRLPLGLWRWQGGDFSLLSFRKDVLDRVTPRLRIEETPKAAQIRLQARDFSESALAPWLDDLYVRRAQQVALGNVRLLHLLSNQFRVPRKESLDIANALLDTRLVSLPGGAYELNAQGDDFTCWQATGLSMAPSAEKLENVAPLLRWFRGLNLDVARQQDRLTLHADIDMQRQTGTTANPLKLIESLLGGKKDRTDAEQQKPPAKP